MPLGVWGMAVAHFGLAITVFAITGVSAWKEEASAFLMPGQSLEIAGYTVELDDVRRLEGANYIAEEGQFAISRGQRELGDLVAERRFYPVRQMSTTESAIRTRSTGDLYVTIGEPSQERGWPVFLYVYPFAMWLWVGSGVLTLGGVLSIADRGRRSLKARKSAPAPADSEKAATV